MRPRTYYNNLVQQRVDEVVPIGDTVTGGTAIGDPQDFFDKELDLSSEHVLRIASLDLVIPSAHGNLKHFYGNKVQDVSTRIEVRSDLSALLYLPESYLRFVIFKATGFKRSLTPIDIISIADPKYQYQREHVAIAGNVNKPVGALYPIADSDLRAPELGKYLLTKIFTTAQTVSGLDNDTSGIATGNVFALIAQAITTENGTYLTNASGVAPTKLSDQFNLVTILTFSSVPAYTLGETVVQASTGAVGKVICKDSTNNQIVLSQSSYLFAASAVVTGDTSAVEGSPTAEADYTKGEHSGYAIELFRVATSDTIELFKFVPRLPVEEMPDRLSESVIWHTAAKYLEANQRTDLANPMYEKAVATAQVYQTGV